MALIFWEDKFFRYLFIATSVMFGIVVLMAHLHYSIDVLAAFFITYSIFKIAVFFFKKDRELFLKK
jgi:membrane-associated phospholipid phosphatase